MLLRDTVTALTDGVGALHAMARAGLIPLLRPDQVVRTAMAVDELGPIAGAIHGHRVNGVDRIAVIDDHGALTFQQLDLMSNALARAWVDEGHSASSVFGLICRNHRGLFLTVCATAKLGARVVLLNTGSAAPQLAAVAAREEITAYVYDAEFGATTSEFADVARYVSWSDHGDEPEDRTLTKLIDGRSTDPVDRPAEPGIAIQLTSGTTGTPKGVPRSHVSPLAAAQILDRIPLRAEQTIVVAAPAFHATGLGFSGLGLALRSTLVMTRKFDAEHTLALVAEHRADTLILVPTMLQRVLDLGQDTIASYDTSNLKVVLSAGSALSPDLCRRTAEYLGDVLYNLYGSTEVAVATVATPKDLERSPGTAGSTPITCRVALYDDNGKKIHRAGVTGRIFAANGASFTGYTDGLDKERIDGLLSTGDSGHFDKRGMLFVEGRDDDIIVSGGENVHPVEVENLLADREDVLEVGVIGVPDDHFGQRLRAFVVPTPDSTPDAQEIRNYVKARLARHMVPRDVVFLEDLPRNATGKLLRSALAEIHN